MKWSTNLFAVGLAPSATVGVVVRSFVVNVEVSLVGVGLKDTNFDFVGHLAYGQYADKGSERGERTI